MSWKGMVKCEKWIKVPAEAKTAETEEPRESK
jgi:hypothetical protein